MATKKQRWATIRKDVDCCQYYKNKVCMRDPKKPCPCIIHQEQKCKIFAQECLPSLGEAVREAWKGDKSDVGLAAATTVSVGMPIQEIEAKIGEYKQLAELHGKAFLEAAAKIGGLLLLAKGWFTSDTLFGMWAETKVGFSRQHRHRLMKLANFAREQPNLFAEADSWRAAEALWHKAEVPSQLEIESEGAEDGPESPGSSAKKTLAQASSSGPTLDDRVSILSNQVILATAFLQKLIGGELKRPRTTAKAVLDAMQKIGDLPDTKVLGPKE